MLTKLPAGFFYGTTTPRRDIGGLTFSESVYRDELRIPEHEHVNAFFNLVLEGTYTEICRNQVRTRGPWSVALHPSGEAHADRWHGLGGRVRRFARSIRVAPFSSTIGPFSQRSRTG